MAGRHRRTRVQTPELRHTEIVDGWSMSVLKVADTSDDVGMAAISVLGLVIAAVTHGFLLGVSFLDEPRWLVQVAPVEDPESPKTVLTTFSYRGARLGAWRARRKLASGGADAFGALPDYVW